MQTPQLRGHNKNNDRRKQKERIERGASRTFRPLARS